MRKNQTVIPAATAAILARGIQDLAEVFDTKTKRGMGLYSSYRDGSDYREQAETQCNALNRANK